MEHPVNHYTNSPLSLTAGDMWAGMEERGLRGAGEGRLREGVGDAVGGREADGRDVGGGVVGGGGEGNMGVSENSSSSRESSPKVSPGWSAISSSIRKSGGTSG